MILIYGASGFLGSAITNKLSGNNPVVAVVRPNSNTKLINKSSNLQIKTLDTDGWAEAINELQPKVVICAQWDGVAKEERDNKEKQFENVSAITNIAKHALNNKVSKFITLGSQAETKPSEGLVPETALDSGENWYGKSKSKLHKDLIEMLKGSDTELIWARVFSIYGPGESRDSLINAIKKKSKENEIFAIREPNRLWSFLYIDDFATAIETILNMSGESLVVNIANPHLAKIKDICSELQGARIHYENQLEHLADGYFPATDKLINSGWAPRVALAEGCRIIWNSSDT